MWETSDAVISGDYIQDYIQIHQKKLKNEMQAI